MGIKPLTTAQKNVLRHLALAIVAADLERKIIKPAALKEGKHVKDGDFRKFYFKKVPQVGQAERAFKAAIKKAEQDILASFERDKEKA